MALRIAARGHQCLQSWSQQAGRGVSFSSFLLLRCVTEKNDWNQLEGNKAGGLKFGLVQILRVFVTTVLSTDLSPGLRAPTISWLPALLVWWCLF